MSESRLFGTLERLRCGWAGQDREGGEGRERAGSPCLFLEGTWLSDPPPLKWSDLRYVFDIQEDCNGKEALQARRDRREAAPGRCSGLAGPGHDGGDPADRCERGDLLSLASRVWRAE